MFLPANGILLFPLAETKFLSQKPTTVFSMASVGIKMVVPAEPMDITQTLLLSLAGRAAYDRGAAYYRNGAVQTVEKAGAVVSATVSGSDDYSVKLQHTAQILDGSCNCPASDGFDFCKHCVAVALHIKQQQNTQRKLLSGDDKDRIHAHLLNMDHDVLAKSLLDLICQDKLLSTNWQLKADLASGKLGEKMLRRRITSVTRGRAGLYRHSAVKIFFRNMLPEISLLKDLLGRLPSEQLLSLVLYFYQRITLACEKVDDSGGYRFEVQTALQSLHLQILRTHSFSREQLTKHLLDLRLSKSIDNFNDIPQSFDSLLGEEGLSNFYAQSIERWQALSAVQKRAEANSNLFYLLREHAQSTNDIATEILIYRDAASSDYDLSHLASLYIQQGERAAAQTCVDAMSDADEAAVAEKARIQSLVFQAGDDTGEALEAMWQYFLLRHTLEAYQSLRTLYAEDNQRALIERVVAELCGSKASAENRAIQHQLVIEILLSENLVALAWRVAVKFKIADIHLLELARLCAVNKDKYEKQLSLVSKVFKSVIAEHIETGTKSSFSIAIDLIDEYEAFNLGGGYAEFQDFINNIRMIHQAKRAFIKMIDDRF